MGKKTISLLLVIVMLLSLLPTAVFAETDNKTFTYAGTVISGKQYLLVSKCFALTNADGTSVSATEVTVTNDKITLDANSANYSKMLWTAGTSNVYSDNGIYTFKNGNDYFARISNDNLAQTETSVSARSVWNYDGSDLEHKNSKSTHYYVQYNNGFDANNALQEAKNAGLTADQIIYTTGNHEYNPGNYSNGNTYSAKSAIKRIGEAAKTSTYNIYCFGAAAYDQSFTSADISDLSNYLAGVGTQKFVFVLSHFPLHSFGMRSSGNADAVISLLNRYPNVIFLWGHNHSQSDTHYDSVNTTAIGSTGINFTYAAAGCMSDSEYTGSASVSGKGMLATVSKDGKTVTLNYLNEDGKTVGGSATVTLSGESGQQETPKTTVNLTLGDQIGMNFNLNLDGKENAKNNGAYAQFTINGAEPQKVYFSQNLKLSDGRYRFTCEVNALQIADTIKFEYFVPDQDQPISTQTTSVAEYLNQRVNNSASAEEKELVKAIADYGHYAQIYLADEHGELVKINKTGTDVVGSYKEVKRISTSNFTRPIVSQLESFKASHTGQQGEIQVNSIALSLESKTKIIIKFTVNQANPVRNVTNRTSTSEKVDYTCEKVSDNQYQLTIKGIFANRLGDRYEISFVNGFTLQVTALTYAYTVLNKSASSSTEQTKLDHQKDAVAALYYYYAKTMNYINAK